MGWVRIPEYRASVGYGETPHVITRTLWKDDSGYWEGPGAGARQVVLNPSGWNNSYKLGYGSTRSSLSPAPPPQENHASQPSPAGEGAYGYGTDLGGNKLEIPDDAYPQSKSTSTSRAGLPQWGLDIVKGVGQRIPGLLDDLSGSIQNLAGMEGYLQQAVAKQGTAYLQGLGDFQNYLRKPLEGLAARGVLDSTMLRDAMTNLGGLLADDYAKHQTTLESEALKLGAQNLKDTVSARSTAAKLAAEILGLGKVTTSQSETTQEDKLARYSLLLQTLMS